MDVGVPARLTHEHQHELAGHVERGQQSGDQSDHPQDAEPASLSEGDSEDLVLGPEPGERRNPGDGDGGDRHGRRRHRHRLAEAAHLRHVLLVAHAVDHRAGTEKEQGLEEGMGHEMEDPGDVSGRPDREEHVPELADGRVGQDSFDVGLGHGDRGGPQSGDGADGRDDGPGDR